MTTVELRKVLRHLERAAAPPDGGTLSDAQLLESYLAQRDAGAFAALVRRHGPMVLGVCRRVLRHEQDAEDAFQATFLVLACRAAAVRPRHLVGNWLHGVARRTALAARRAAARRLARERRASAATPTSYTTEPDSADLRAAIDAEVSRLPEKYRAPVVLCDLEGRTHREAARQLGWSEGTLSGRLSRARALLARRLIRRGVGPVAALPPALVASTVRAATEAAPGSAAGAGLSPHVVALAEGVMRMMWMAKVKQAVLALLALAVLGLGAGAALVADEADPRPKTAGERDFKKAPPTPETEKGQPGGKRDPRKAPGKGRAGEEKLPTGPAPYQVLARMDKDGKLVVRSFVHYYEQVPAITPEGQKVMTKRLTRGIVTKTYAKGFKVTDTRGKPVAAKTLRQLLRKEKPVLASADGKAVDPLHLRLVKDGTLILILPVPRGKAAPPVPLPEVVPQPAAPPPAPAVENGPPGEGNPSKPPPKGPIP
jgi:RNA polymerase sigma factor (sigma-70 family)